MDSYLPSSPIEGKFDCGEGKLTCIQSILDCKHDVYKYTNGFFPIRLQSNPNGKNQLDAYMLFISVRASS